MSEMSGRTPVCRMRPFVGTVRTEMSACPGARHASSGSVARPVSRAVVVAVVAGSVSRLAVSRAVVIFVAFGAFVFRSVSAAGIVLCCYDKCGGSVRSYPEKPNRIESGLQPLATTIFFCLSFS